MSGALAGATSNLAGLANVLQSLFLGGSKSEGTSGTKTETSAATSSTRSDQSVIDRLQELFDGALANAKNPEAVKPVVDNILRQAQLAFTPQLGKEAQSGLYNTTVRKQLADQAVADATGASAQAILNYVTQQQQIAGQTGGTLAGAAKTTASSGTNASTGTTAGKAATAPAIPKNIGSIAGLGLAGYSLYKNKDSLLSKLGIGGGSGSSPEAALASTGTNFPQLADTGAYQLPLAGRAGIEEAIAGTPVANFTDSIDGLTGGIPGLEGITTDAGSLLDSVAGSATDLGFATLPDIGTMFDFTGMEELSTFLPDIGAGALDITGMLGDFGGTGALDEIFEILGGIF